VVGGEYPELGVYNPALGSMNLLDTAAAALSKEFNGTIIEDYNEP
jgi:hypothetical protein